MLCQTVCLGSKHKWLQCHNGRINDASLTPLEFAHFGMELDARTENVANLELQDL
jgi:hypothetical protein